MWLLVRAPMCFRIAGRMNPRWTLQGRLEQNSLIRAGNWIVGHSPRHLSSLFLAGRGLFFLHQMARIYRLLAADYRRLVGSIRNAKAIAGATQDNGKRILIVAAGERWPDGTMRPAVEDWIGAGAIIHYVNGKRSPEAESARAAFLNAQDSLPEILQQCSSGRELIERGFGSDVDYASALNVSQIAPHLRDQCYSA